MVWGKITKERLHSNLVIWTIKCLFIVRKVVLCVEHFHRCCLIRKGIAISKQRKRTTLDWWIDMQQSSVSIITILLLNWVKLPTIPWFFGQEVGIQGLCFKVKCSSLMGKCSQTLLFGSLDESMTFHSTNNSFGITISD